MSCKTIYTGVNLRIPDGCHVDIKSRSGLACKNQVFILNADGLIDEDYVGEGENYEICAILFNLGTKDFVINHGDRIAQMILRHSIEEELQLDPPEMDYEKIREKLGSERMGGFGSTGV
jgi:dUTP pyrophosphatase